MKYLLFDYSAISKYIQINTLQSVEYNDGEMFVRYLRGEIEKSFFFNTAIITNEDGVIFSGGEVSDKRILCIDLTQCLILDNITQDSELLTLIQRTFRVAIKIWEKQPFSSSERVNNSKTILFPFALHDNRRIVIERSIQERLKKRGMEFPLLAYKFTDCDATSREDDIDESVLRLAGETYQSMIAEIALFFKKNIVKPQNVEDKALFQVSTDYVEGREDFIFWNYKRQRNSLTIPQKSIVDNINMISPIRIEGAAGTGKTISMLLRALRILMEYREKDIPIRIIFFSHSNSTLLKNKELFSCLESGGDFLNENSSQNIHFTTLLDFCCTVSGFSKEELIEKDALDAKTYGLFLIESLFEKEELCSKIKSFYPLLSEHIKQVFDSSITDVVTLCKMLQHEFGVQIKGRTNGTLEEYKELPSITNGLRDLDTRDKELIFSLYVKYQDELKKQGNYDIDDVIIEALSLLNAPRWRRQRQENGYDYIFVDEMHLFNINEQMIFHYLTKGMDSSIPLCFALDYCQSIGDRGDTKNDYIERTLTEGEHHTLATVFRNSPSIIEFCRSISAAGALMFNKDFANPYIGMQSTFTQNDESKSLKPCLYMYESDYEMYSSLQKRVDGMKKNLQCKLCEIAIISFDENFIAKKDRISDYICDKYVFLRNGESLVKKDKDSLIIASPYDINGLEFSGVILLGVDEGRIPQTTGVSDVSQHYLKYSSYNLLYLCSSRAKYQLDLLGTEVRGISSCLKHSLESGYLDMKEANML